MAHKTPTLIQPRIRSSVRAQRISLNYAALWTTVSTLGGATEWPVSTRYRTHPL